MACRLVALDKCPWVRPEGIGEMISCAIVKLVFRVEGDQEKTACRSLELCAGLEASTAGVTHTMVQRQ